MKRNIVIFILTLLAVLYFYSTNLATKTEQLSLYTNAKLESTTITQLLSKAYGKDNYGEFSFEADKLVIQMLDTDDFYVYLRAEHDAAILFTLFDKLSTIDYVSATKHYTFLKEQFAFTTLDEITAYYQKLENQKKYLGKVKDYLIFDQTDICSLSKESVYETPTNLYYLECSKPSLVEIVKDDQIYTLSFALGSQFFTVDELMKTQLNVLVEAK